MIKVDRKTNETDITVELELYGTGKSDINTGVPFLDHMLDQIARHGLVDLTIKCDGDTSRSKFLQSELYLGQHLFECYQKPPTYLTLFHE